MKHTISNSLIIFSFLLMVAGCVKEKTAVLLGITRKPMRSLMPLAKCASFANPLEADYIFIADA